MTTFASYYSSFLRESNCLVGSCGAVNVAASRRGWVNTVHSLIKDMERLLLRAEFMRIIRICMNQTQRLFRHGFSEGITILHSQKLKKVF